MSITSRTLFLAALATTLRVPLLAAAPPTVTPTQTPAIGVAQNAWVANQQVFALTVTGNTLYMGGSFTQVGPRTGMFVPIPLNNQTYVSGWPEVGGSGGSVLAMADDGNGGWYIGGNFTFVAGQSRNRLAHIYSNGALDPTWNPGATAAVNALLRVNDVLYVGGSFTGAGSLGGASRGYVGAISASAGTVLPWNPTANNIVYALAASGTAGPIYVGGDFTNIGNQSRARLAALADAVGSTGWATTYNPSVNTAATSVRALAVSSSTVYLGGSFNGANSVGTATRSRIAATDAAGVVTAGFTNGTNNGTVFSLTLTATALYVGGSWSGNIGGISRPRIAKLDLTTGAADAAFNAATTGNGQVNALVVAGSNLIAGGTYTQLNNVTTYRLARVNAATGAIDAAWQPQAPNTVSALGTDGTNLFAGGSFQFMNARIRNRLAAIDLVANSLTAWDPGVNNGQVNAIVAGGTWVYAGGTFNGGNVGGQARNYLAALNQSGTGLATTFSVQPDLQVNCLYLTGTALYAGGAFTLVGAAASNRLARINTSTGAFDASFAPDVNSVGSVLALDLVGNTLYAGGSFTSVNTSLTRNRAAAFDTVSGTALAWDPNAGGNVNAIKWANGSVLLGGAFTTLNGGPTRNRLAAVQDAAGGTGTVTAWDPNLNGTVQALQLDRDVLYVGGAFTTVNGVPATRTAALNLINVAPFNWGADADGTVNALCLGGGLVHMGGNHTLANQLPFVGYTAALPQPQPTATPTMTSTSTHSPTSTRTSTPTQTSTATPTATSTVTPTNSATLTITPSQTSTSTASPTATPSPTSTITPTASPSSTVTQTLTPGALGGLSPNTAVLGIPTLFTWSLQLNSLVPIYRADITLTAGAFQVSGTAGMAPLPGGATVDAFANSLQANFSPARSSTDFPNFFNISFTAIPLLGGLFTWGGHVNQNTAYGIEQASGQSFNVLVVSATFTATRTTTPTMTPTSTESPSSTRTPTSTNSPSSTDTPTLSPSSTITETFSSSPTPTSTETTTNTRTPTPTSTASPTPVDTATGTLTSTATMTSSVTQTSTHTPTRTHTPTATTTQTPGLLGALAPQVAVLGVPSIFTFSFQFSSSSLIDQVAVTSTTGAFSHLGNAGLAALPGGTTVDTFANTVVVGFSPARNAGAFPSFFNLTVSALPLQTGTFFWGGYLNGNEGYPIELAPGQSFQVVVVTATQTTTPTASPTPTATPTASPTGTATPTATDTPTATASITPSNTVTPTGTPTSTPTATQTFTSTSTPSATGTPNATASTTPTATVTLTQTPGALGALVPNVAVLGIPTVFTFALQLNSQALIGQAALTLTTGAFSTVGNAGLSALPAGATVDTFANTVVVAFTPARNAGDFPAFFNLTVSALPLQAGTFTWGGFLNGDTAYPIALAPGESFQVLVVTATQTATPSASPSATATSTASATLSSTPSATESSTSTSTPSATGTPSASATATSSITPSVTPTCTGTAVDSSTPTPTSSATGTASPTETQTPVPTPTRTTTFTPVSSATATSVSTPTVDNTGLTGQDRELLGPQPLRSGQDLCLYFASRPLSSHWDFYRVDQRLLFSADFGAGLQACWNSAGLAPGVYYVRVEVAYADGLKRSKVHKVLVVP